MQVTVYTGFTINSFGQAFGYGPGPSGSGLGSGDNGDFIPFRAKPPRPTGVVVLVTSPFNLLVRWTDYVKTLPSDIGFYWSVRWCPISYAGQPSNSLWIPGILAKSTSIGGWVRAEGRGKRMSWTYEDQSLSDGYIIVVGVTDRGYVGEPSTPVLMNITGNVNERPDVQTVIPGAMTISKERVPYEVIKIDATWFTYQKNDLKQFRGVHLHVVNWDGVATPRELGSMAPWDGSSGVNLATYRLPLVPSSGLGGGVATLSNGGNVVSRVSGTNFDVTWLNRKIVFDIDATTAWTQDITSVTPPNTINTGDNFTGTTGDYTWQVLSNATFYFVPIGVSGLRVGDYTTANSVTI